MWYMEDPGSSPLTELDEEDVQLPDLQGRLIRLLSLRKTQDNTDFGTLHDTLLPSSVSNLYKTVEKIADKFGNQYYLKPSILLSIDRSRYSVKEKEVLHEKISTVHFQLPENLTTLNNTDKLTSFWTCIDDEIPIAIIHSQIDSDDYEVRYEETCQIREIVLQEYNKYVSEIRNLKEQLPELQTRMEFYRSKICPMMSIEDVEKLQAVIDEVQVNKDRLIESYALMKAHRRRIQTYDVMLVYWNDKYAHKKQ